MHPLESRNVIRNQQSPDPGDLINIGPHLKTLPSGLSALIISFLDQLEAKKILTCVPQPEKTQNLTFLAGMLAASSFPT